MSNDITTILQFELEGEEGFALPPPFSDLPSSAFVVGDTIDIDCLISDVLIEPSGETYQQIEPGIYIVVGRKISMRGGVSHSLDQCGLTRAECKHEESGSKARVYTTIYLEIYLGNAGLNPACLKSFT